MDALRRLLREHLAALERAATAPPSRARDTRALSTAAAAHAAAAEGPHRAAAPEFIAIAGLVRSPLGEALFLLLAGLSAGALALLARWSPRVWCAFARARAEAFADADFVLVVGPDGTASEIPVVRAQAFVAFAGGKRLESVRYFEYRKLRYVYSPRFASFQRQSPRLDESFADVHAMRAGRSADEAAVLLLANGPNSIDVGATPLSNLVADKLLHPFYVFQIASVAIWIAESYTSYALLILLLSTASAAWEVAEAVRNEAHLRSMAASAPVAYPVLRDGALLNLGPAELVVGDAVVLSAAMDSLIGHHVACDLLLVQGECVMDEAALTGESVPVVKLPLPYTDNDATDEDLDDNNVPRDAHTRWPSHAQAGDGNDNGDGGDVPQGPRSAASAKRSFIDPDRHKKHILFSGSKFVELKPRRSWGFAPSAASGNDLDPEMVVAVVLATGFSSSKGELVRSILFPAHVELKFNVDAYKFLAALGAVAAAAFLNRFVTACRSGTPWFLALVSSLDLITIAVPPALPLVLTVGTGLALERLRRSQVFCIAPARINYAGRIDVMCWDKTGTLTVPKLAFCGVDPGGNGILQQAAHPADAGRDATAKGLAAAPPSVETCMAVCHGVVLDESGTELGNPVDVEMLRASRWRIDPSPPPAAFTDAGVPVVCTVSPASDPLPTSDPMHFGPASVTPSASAISSIHTLRRFEFDPHVQRTSVIVCAAPSPAAAPWRIYTKGSPEAILHVCRPQSIPSDYFAVCQQLSVQGLYVLACASREVEPGEFPSCSAPQAPSLSSLPPGDVSAGPAAALARCRRERVENNLVFLGFVAFENPIRPEAFETISELREAMVRSVIM
nr:hypothetical protein HK105_006532 [Polyrhizophydium stewartii]